MKKKILEFLAKTLNMPAEEVTDLYNTGDENDISEDAYKTLLEKDKERVKELRDKGYSKATKEQRSAYEKEIKEAYKLESDKVGLELISELVETKTANPKSISEDAVKKHPLYVALEKSKEAIKDEVSKEWQTKLDAKEKEYTQKENAAKAKELHYQTFKELGIAFSSDEKKAANQMKMLAELINQGKAFEFVEGTVIVTDSEGKPLEDEHGNKIKYKDLVKSVALEYFDIPVSTQRTSPTGDNKQQTTTTGKLYGQKLPANDTEYNQMLDSLRGNLPAIKELQTDYKASKANPVST